RSGRRPAGRNRWLAPDGRARRKSAHPLRLRHPTGRCKSDGPAAVAHPRAARRRSFADRALAGSVPFVQVLLGSGLGRHRLTKGSEQARVFGEASKVITIILYAPLAWGLGCHQKCWSLFAPSIPAARSLLRLLSRPIQSGQIRARTARSWAGVVRGGASWTLRRGRARLLAARPLEGARERAWV